MKGLSHQVSKLVGVLTHHGDPHSAGPVVVEVGQLVGQRLDVLGLQAWGVLDDIVAGGVDSPLPDRLTDKEKVVSKLQGM